MGDCTSEEREGGLIYILCSTQSSNERRPTPVIASKSPRIMVASKVASFLTSMGSRRAAFVDCKASRYWYRAFFISDGAWTKCAYPAKPTAFMLQMRPSLKTSFRDRSSKKSNCPRHGPRKGWLSTYSDRKRPIAREGVQVSQRSCEHDSCSILWNIDS